MTINKLTEGQLLFRLQDFYGAEQDAIKTNDHEYAQECSDVVCIIREVMELRKSQDQLESFRTAFMEYSDKTDWVQGDKRFDVLKPWGKHRADVLREFIEHIESKLEAAEKRIAELEAREWTGEASDEELNAALQEHRLKVVGHSQLSDAFRAGFKYARRAAAAGKGDK